MYWQLPEVATDVRVYLLADPGGSHGCVRISTAAARGSREQRGRCGEWG